MEWLIYPVLMTAVTLSALAICAACLAFVRHLLCRKHEENPPKPPPPPNDGLSESNEDYPRLRREA